MSGDAKIHSPHLAIDRTINPSVLPGGIQVVFSNFSPSIILRRRPSAAARSGGFGSMRSGRYAWQRRPGCRSLFRRQPPRSPPGRRSGAHRRRTVPRAPPGDTARSAGNRGRRSAQSRTGSRAGGGSGPCEQNENELADVKLLPTRAASCRWPRITMLKAPSGDGRWSASASVACAVRFELKQIADPQLSLERVDGKVFDDWNAELG